MIKVVLVDDHQIFRDGILSLFNEVRDIKIVGVASNADEAIENVKMLKPDVILLDISLPDTSGIEIIENYETF